MTTHDESHIIRTSPKRMAQGLAIVVGVLVFGAIILVINWNNMVKVPPPVSSIALQPPGGETTSETQGTTTTATEGGGGGGAATTTGGGAATTTAPATGGGGGAAPAPAGTTTAAAAATLTIPNGAATPGNPAYEPASLTVKKGDAIDVVNKDSSPHTVTSGTGLEDPNAGKMFDTSIITPAASAQLATADLEAGEYDYHCSVHPFMTGKIIVQ
jgi:plastocyanin